MTLVAWLAVDHWSVSPYNYSIRLLRLFVLGVTRFPCPYEFMAVCERQIWQKLLTASPRGFLRWQLDVEGRIRHDPGKGTDSRGNPERYMVMCGRLHTLEEHRPVFTTDDLIRVAPHEFVTHKGEITGVNGLLRLVDKFPITIPTPEEILLVGSISPNSLLSVLAWCREKGWVQTHVTLVDNSAAPIETLRLMQEGGYFDWSGGVNLIEKDILDYHPDRQTDVVIADILNVWMTDTYHYPHLDRRSPYAQFEKFLRWGARAVGNDGWFLSRCMIFPSLSRGKSDPNLKFAQGARERGGQVLDQLGDLAKDIDSEAIRESVERLFDAPLRTTFCGLDRVCSTYKSEPTLAGSRGLRVSRRLHNRNFRKVHEILVKDEQSGFKYLNLACQGE